MALPSPSLSGSILVTLNILLNNIFQIVVLFLVSGKLMQFRRPHVSCDLCCHFLFAGGGGLSVGVHACGSAPESVKSVYICSHQVPRTVTSWDKCHYLLLCLKFPPMAVSAEATSPLWTVQLASVPPLCSTGHQEAQGRLSFPGPVVART